MNSTCRNSEESTSVSTTGDRNVLRNGWHVSDSFRVVSEDSDAESIEGMRVETILPPILPREVVEDDREESLVLEDDELMRDVLSELDTLVFEERDTEELHDLANPESTSAIAISRCT